MGNITAGSRQSSNITYCVPLEGTAVPSKRTAIYRSSFSPNKFIDNLQTGEPCQNTWDLFQRGVATAGDAPCLGTRERLPDGTLGKYIWKTYKEVETLALQVGSGLLTLQDALPILDFPKEPLVQHFRFLGLYSKNREEWVVCEQACNAYAITIVPLYDTLGADSAMFILSQTQLRTVVASEECASKLVEMLEDLNNKKNSSSSSAACVTGPHEQNNSSSNSSSDRTAAGAGAKIMKGEEVSKTTEEKKEEEKKEEDKEDEEKTASTLSSGERFSSSFSDEERKNSTINYDNIHVKYIIVMGNEEEEERNKISRTELQTRADLLGVSLIPWRQVLQLGREHPVARTGQHIATPRSVNTICYTSGTTGQPKGVTMSHANFLAAVAGSIHGPLTTEGMQLHAGDRYLSYLPLAHAYERSLQNILFALGGSIGFHGGETLKLLDDVQELEPTVFASVPRLFNRIHDRVFESVRSKSVLAQAIFNQGLSTKMQKLHSTGIPQHAFWDKIVFSKTKSILGSRLRYMLVGSAPLESAVQEKIKALFAVPLVEGYGLTETVAASFISQVRDGSSGHIGGCCPSLEFSLFDISEDMPQYKIEDTLTPAGELCLRGPVVTCGYFCNPEETAKAIDNEGWLHTGDVATLVPNSGALRIIDRKKNIFKLAQGEYVAPEKIENIYIQARLVFQAFIFGYSTQYCVVGVIVPDEEQAEKWKKQNNLQNLSFSQLCKEPSFCNAVEQEMMSAAKKHQLKGFEMVKKIYLEPEPFSVANGLLTPTFKIKRFIAKERFKGEIDRMYEALANAAG